MQKEKEILGGKFNYFPISSSQTTIDNSEIIYVMFTSFYEYINDIYIFCSYIRYDDII